MIADIRLMSLLCCLADAEGNWRWCMEKELSGFKQEKWNNTIWWYRRYRLIQKRCSELCNRRVFNAPPFKMSTCAINNQKWHCSKLCRGKCGSNSSGPPALGERVNYIRQTYSKMIFFNHFSFTYNTVGLQLTIISITLINLPIIL